MSFLQWDGSATFRFKKAKKAVQKLSISCPKLAGKWARDVNTEMVTKVAPVRDVELSIGAFCTEFRCEQLCDDGILSSRVKIWIFRHGFQFFLYAVAIVFFTCGGPPPHVKKTSWYSQFGTPHIARP